MRVSKYNNIENGILKKFWLLAKRVLCAVLLFSFLATSATPAYAAISNSLLGKYHAALKNKFPLIFPDLAQNKSFGVLAMNSNQSVYQLGGTARMAFAVLDTGGLMVCDADLSLVVIHPNLYTAWELTTANGGITVNPECRQKNFTQRPDFEAEFPVMEEGVYGLVLTARTKLGTHTIKDIIKAEKTPSFLVERLAPTRTFPAVHYPIQIKITAKEDVVATVTEKVPLSFAITKQPELIAGSLAEAADNILNNKGQLNSSGNSSITLAKTNESQVITATVSLKAGQSKILTYDIDLPDISPAFYTLGPVWMSGQNSADGVVQGVNNQPLLMDRLWMIANDATASTVIISATTTTTWVVPSDWNSASNTIEVIGGGGAGRSSGSAAGGAGGGGGAYSKIFNTASLTPGSTVTISVGNGGIPGGANGGDTYFCNATSNCASITDSAVVVGAKGGLTATSTGAAAGGQASAGVTTTLVSLKYSGGLGATGTTGSTLTGGGGGGAAGPNGNGAQAGGGDATGTGDDGGGGGGGNGGGTGGAPGTTSGGGGGNNSSGSGGGTAVNNNNGNAGSNGGGGAGGDDGKNGGNGGDGIEWSTAGSGGGGGGGGNAGVAGTQTGGNGGLYGGGGGGGEVGGYGGKGLIVIVYTPIITISGTAKDSETGSALTSKTVKVLVNGTATSTATTDGSGNWSVNPSSLASGDIITAYISGDTNKGMTVTRASGTDATNMAIYANVVRLVSDDNATITTSNLSTANTNVASADRMYSVSGNDLTVTEGYKLRVDGKYGPIGNVTVDALGLFGTYDAGFATTTIRRGGTGTTCTGGVGTVMPFCVSGGTLFASTSLFSFQATSTALIASTTYYRLTLAPANTGSPEFSFQSGTTTVGNNMEIGNGINAVTATTTSSNANFAITGSLTINSSATLAGGGTGNIIVSGGASGGGTVSLTAGNFELRGTNNLSNTSSWTFNNLRIGNGAVGNITSVGSATITVSSILTIGSGSTLNAGPKPWVLSGAGTPISRSGTFTASTSTFSLTSASGVTAISSAAMTNGNSFYNLVINGSGTFTAGVDVTANNNFSILSGTLTAPSNLSVGGSFANSGTFTHNNGTTTFTATSGTKTITGSTTFSSLVFSGSGGTFSVASTANIVTAGNLTITAGTVNGSGGITVGQTLSVTDTLAATGTVVSLGAVSGNGTINMEGGSFETQGAFNFGGNAAWTFYDLKIGNGAAATTTAVGTGNITVTGQLLIGSSSVLNAGAKTWILNGGGTPFSSLGTFTASSSTVSYRGTTGTIAPASVSYYNLDFSPTSGNPAFSLLSQGWYSSPSGGSWDYRKAITIDYTKVASSTGETYANFPVLISLTDSNLKFTSHGGNVASSTGADILFTSSDGTTKLAHEIEKYASSTGETIAWVKVPSLSTSTNTTLYMYYGNASASDQQQATSTWNSAYRFVYHLDDGDSTAADFYQGSTNNNIDATLVDGDGDSFATSTSKIGTGFEFSGDNIIGGEDYLAVSDTNDPTAYTHSVWVKPDLKRLGIVTRTDATGPTAAWSHQMHIDPTGRGVSYTYDGGTQCTTGTSVIGTAGWIYLVATAENSGNLRIYVNGVEEGTADTVATLWTGGDRWRIGQSTGTTDGCADVFGVNYFDGVMDEFRHSTVARSADWIKTEYNNQSSTSTFYSLGIEEDVPSASIAISNNVTLGGSGNITLDANTNDVALDIDGSFVIGSGDVFLASNSATTTVGASFTNSGTFTHNNGNVAFDGSGSSNTVNAGNSSFYNLTLSGSGTWTSQSTTSVDNILTVGASATLNGGTSTIVLSGTGTPLSVLGTFTASTSMVSYRGVSGTTTPANVSYYNLDFSPQSGSPVYQLPAGGGGWYDNNWPYRIPITVDYTKVGTTTSITGFPVLFSTSTLAALKHTANGGHVGKSDGTDILVTEGNGTTKLPHQIEKYSSSTGETILWFRTSTSTPISTSTNTTYYVYYGNAAASDQQDVSDGTNDVWDSSYQLIYHLGDGDSTAAAFYQDATSNNRDGTLADPDGDTAVMSGKIGAALNFNGDDDLIDSNATINSASFTTQAWVILDTEGSNKYIYFEGTAGGRNLGYYLGDCLWSFNYPDFCFAHTVSTVYHIVYTRSGTSALLYINGVQVDNATISDEAGGELWVGNYGGGGFSWDGMIDEFRYSSAVRSAAWIYTEYQNQNNPNTFYTIGSETANSSLNISNNLSIGGLGNATVSAYASNTPVTVTGSLTIGSGDTFEAATSSSLTIGGNFTNNGTFTHNGGTVVFDTTATSTITSGANMSFNNFTSTTAGKGLVFSTSGSPVFTIAGTMTITGTAGSPISIISNSAGTQWLAYFSSAQSAVSYAYLKDSGCFTGTAAVTQNNFTNGGNNGTCWGYSAVTIVQGSGGGGTEGSGGGGTLVTGGGSGGGSGGSGGSSGDIPISFVNATSSQVMNGAFTELYATINATSGNLLYVLVASDVAGANCDTRTWTVTDTAGNTYTQISQTYSYYCTVQFYAKNINGNSNLDITVGVNPGTVSGMTVLQFSGVDTSNPLDATASSTSAVASTLTSSSFSTSQANEVIIAGGTSYFNPNPWTAGSAGGNSLAIPANATTNSGNGRNTTASYAITSSVQSSITASITRSSSDVATIVVATFKGGVGGTGGGSGGGTLVTGGGSGGGGGGATP